MNKVNYSKYRNTKVIVDGIKFDSKHESQRYQELKLMERAGVIDKLALQVPFILIDKSKYGREIKYIADFVYYDNETKNCVVEDAKSPATRKDKVYRLKKRLMAELWEIEIKEV